MNADRMGSLEEDAGLRQMLAQASDPPLPQGAEARLLSRIAATPQDRKASQLIAFQSARAQRAFGLAVALPLAASLLLGIYIGNDAARSFYLPDKLAGLSSAAALEIDVPVDLDEQTDEDDDLT